LSGSLRKLEVGVPVCETCRETINRRQRTGGAIGLLVGTVVGTAVGGLLGVWLGDGRASPVCLGAMIGLCLAALVGSTVGLVLSRRLPVRFRRYNPTRGTVSVRFDNPEIAARVIARLREHAPASARSPGNEPEEF
jgi:hypothetical protein